MADDTATMIRLAVNEACANAGAHTGMRRIAAVDAASAKIVALLKGFTSERDRLREALRRYGDRIGMANAPPHLQQEIDAAMSEAPQ